MKKAILLLFFALGFFSLLTQTLIVREFIVSFGGNELGIGLFYFFWLFWVGIGSFLVFSFLGAIFDKHFLKLLFLYPILAFIEIALFISLKGIANVSWWEFFSLEKVFLYLFLFTSFISLFTGIIFTLGLLWLKRHVDSHASKIVSISYVAESLGSFFSGSIVTLLIAQLIAPLIILVWASLLFSVCAAIASIRFKEKVSAIFNFLLFIFFLILTFNPQGLITLGQNLRIKNLLPGATLVSEAYTPYQHIVLTKLPSQIVVLSDGQITSSLPEVIDADSQSALFLCEADNSQADILIFGYGAENLINSLLKFPVRHITYCLEDKVYFKIIKENLSSKQ